MYADSASAPGPSPITPLTKKYLSLFRLSRTLAEVPREPGPKVRDDPTIPIVNAQTMIVNERKGAWIGARPYHRRGGNRGGSSLPTAPAAGPPDRPGRSRRRRDPAP